MHLSYGICLHGCHFCQVIKEWQECFEAVSLLHADVLELETPIEELDKLACRIEDALFDLKEKLSKRIRNVELKHERAESIESGKDGVDSFRESIRIPVDNVAETSKIRSNVEVAHTTKGIDGPSTSTMGYKHTLTRLNPDATPFKEVQHMPSIGSYQQCFPAAPPLKLESYEGDVLKYWDF